MQFGNPFSQRLGAALAGALLLATAGATTALAGTCPSKAYQATYTTQSSSSYGAGNGTRTVMWDGKGHGRTEITNNGRKSVMLVDAPDHKMIMLVEANQMAMEMPLKDEDMQSMGAAMTDQIKDRTSLGVKVIDGHPCHGERYTVGTCKTEAWTADDIGCLIQYKTSDPQMGESSSKLTSYSAQAPSAQALALPAGYKVTNMGALSAESGAP